MIATQAPPTLNYIVAGQVRCGASVLQTSLSTHTKAVCHGNLLSLDLKTRQEQHNRYFAGRGTGKAFEWCQPTLISPEQYLSDRVFDNPLYGESAVGVRFHYQELQELQMWEYFQGWCIRGDFCLIHVRRNPIACLVSLKQAEQTGIWSQSINDKELPNPPIPIYIDLEELVQFCQEHAACDNRVNRTCDDRLEISYRELFLDYKNVMRHVFEFLNLPVSLGVTPQVRRLKNFNIKRRIRNFTALRAEAPPELRDYFDQDLF